MREEGGSDVGMEFLDDVEQRNRAWVPNVFLIFFFFSELDNQEYDSPHDMYFLAQNKKSAVYKELIFNMFFFCFPGMTD